MKKNDTPPYGGILIIISIINIISSIYFFPLFLIGIVFKIFLVSLKKEYYYILAFSIITFLIIEVIQGFKPFLLTVSALFLYYFVMPRIKHIFSSSIIFEGMFILLFYSIIFVVTIFDVAFNMNMFYIFLYNFLIDIVIVGFVI